MCIYGSTDCALIILLTGFICDITPFILVLFLIMILYFVLLFVEDDITMWFVFLYTVIFPPTMYAQNNVIFNSYEMLAVCKIFKEIKVKSRWNFLQIKPLLEWLHAILKHISQRWCQVIKLVSEL